MASAETTSAGISSVSAAATSDLPLAVGPNSPMTCSATKPRADEPELLVAYSRRAKVRLDAAVAVVELREHSSHRGCRCLRDAAQPLEVLLALSPREPRLVPRPQPVLAQRVVGRDLVVGHSGEVEEERRQQPGAVLASDSVDDDSARRRMRDGPHGGGDVRSEALEEDEVDVACRRRDVGGGLYGCIELLGHLLQFVVSALEKRDVHDFHRQLRRRVVRTLVVAAEIYHREDAVIDERLPPVVAQLPDAVRPHDRTESRLAAVPSRQATELADIHTAVPREISRLQLRPAECRRESSRSTPRS